jgi:hypothetical protein
VLFELTNRDGRSRWSPTILTLPDQGALDGSTRLWMNIVQSMLLRELPSHLADCVQSAADRAWFSGLAPASGIPTAAGIGPAPATEARAAPTMTFTPTQDRLAELYLAHRALRRAGTAHSGGRGAELAVLAGIAAELRRRGLWPAYVRAARRARAALGPGSGAPVPGDLPG